MMPDAFSIQNGIKPQKFKKAVFWKMKQRLWKTKRYKNLKKLPLKKIKLYEIMKKLYIWIKKLPKNIKKLYKKMIKLRS
jgi:hypothetical protein